MHLSEKKLCKNKYFDSYKHKTIMYIRTTLVSFSIIKNWTWKNWKNPPRAKFKTTELQVNNRVRLVA